MKAPISRRCENRKINKARRDRKRISKGKSSRNQTPIPNKMDRDKDNEPDAHVWRPFRIGDYRKERGFSKSLKRFCQEKRYWARKRQRKDVSNKPGQHRSESPGREIVNEVSQFVEEQVGGAQNIQEDIDVDISAACVDPNPEQEQAAIRASVCGKWFENGDRPTVTLRVRRAMTRSEISDHQRRVKTWKEKNIYPYTTKGMYIVDTLSIDLTNKVSQCSLQRNT